MNDAAMNKMFLIYGILDIAKAIVTATKIYIFYIKFIYKSGERRNDRRKLLTEFQFEQSDVSSYRACHT